MQHIKTIALAAVLTLVAGAALASQGPGVSQGTAGPLAQWMAFVCFIGFATLGVVFSQWDDGTYGDF
ncbi:MAG: hypothetical protein WDN48_01435 [Pseudolabrys sp.]